MNSPKINCFHCIHFYITWDPKFPNGCRFFQIKTKNRPSNEVEKSSGLPCQGFEPKKR